MPARASFRDGKLFAERHGAWIGARLRRLPEPDRLCPWRQPCLCAAFRTGSLLRRACGSLALVIAAPPRATAARRCSGCSGDAAFTPRRVQDFLIREARRDLDGGGRAPRRAARCQGAQDHAARHQQPLGFLFGLGRTEFFLAADFGAAFRARLSGRARSRPSRPHEPLGRFWAVVDELSPDVAAAEAWLKANGPGLLRFGAGRLVPAVSNSGGAPRRRRRDSHRVAARRRRRRCHNSRGGRRRLRAVRRSRRDGPPRRRRRWLPLIRGDAAAIVRKAAAAKTSIFFICSPPTHVV